MYGNLMQNDDEKCSAYARDQHDTGTCEIILNTLKEHQLVLTIAIYQRFLIPIVNNGDLF